MKILAKVLIGIFCIVFGLVAGQLIGKVFMDTIVSLFGEKAIINFFNAITI